MSKYEITGRDLQSYSFGSDYYSEAFERYKKQKPYILNPESWAYGSVLVETKKEWCSFNFGFEFNRLNFELKPRVLRNQIEWLWFRVWFNWLYFDSAQKGRVIKDWVSEESQQESATPCPK